MREKEKGQSLVEVALFMPLLIVVLLGLVELGFLFWDIMVLVDQTRELARYAGKGPDFHYENIGLDSTLFVNADAMDLTPETSAIRVAYVSIGQDDEGNAVKISEDTTERGRVDEVEFPALDVEQMVAGHQVILDEYNPRAMPITWVGVSVARWHEPVTGFFDFLRDRPIAIKSQAIFRVGFIRKRETPTPQP